MHILITGGDSRLARALAVALAAEHTIRLLDSNFLAESPAGVTHVQADLREPEQVAAVLVGVETVIHLDPLVPNTGQDAVDFLDRVTRGSYVLFNAARAAGITRFILGSTLATFDRFPAHYKVNEEWRPRPTPQPAQLGAWLAECSVRENVRKGTLQAICLRFGELVEDADIANQPYNPRWLHVVDAIHGVRCALAYQSERRPDWAIFHITAPGPRTKIQLGWQAAANPERNFGYAPTHDFAQLASTAPPARDPRPWRELLTAPQPVPSRPIHRVVIFGAGGPMGTATTQELLSSYRLRVTDLRPLAEIAGENKPQNVGAPLPTPVAPPHEEQSVDVRDPQQVLAACAGMDAIINCTVMRPHPVNAFLVNTIGAYNVMLAAVTHGIRRVVHTGPTVHHPGYAGDYNWDYDLNVDTPARPYDHLYIHSKYLGQEIVRVFADYYALEVPVLLFSVLYNPDPAIVPDGFPNFTISWPDTGRALRRALEVIALPSPYEMIHISADTPVGRYHHDKAHALLNWTARDGLEHLWQA